MSEPPPYSEFDPHPRPHPCQRQPNPSQARPSPVVPEFISAARASIPLGQASIPVRQGQVPPIHPSGHNGTGVVRDVREDQLELLRQYDTIFVIDDSASMQVNEQPDGSIGPSRWEEACRALCDFVRLASKYDDDGIDVHFINNDKSLLHCRDPRDLVRLFHDVVPSGATPTGERLEILLLDYLDAIEQTAETRRRGMETKSAPKRRNVSTKNVRVTHSSNSM